MLDFLLVFSLPKLVFDDEMCGQALRFVRDVEPLDDLPVAELIDQLMADQHLIMARTRRPTGPTSSTCRARSSIATTARRGLRPGRQGHVRAGQRRGRPAARRLSPAETDPAIDAELRGSSAPASSTRPSCRAIPPPPEPVPVAGRSASAATTDGASRRRTATRRDTAMTAPLATPATTDSSTLYFGPWYRRSPFFEKTLEAGC